MALRVAVGAWCGHAVAARVGRVGRGHVIALFRGDYEERVGRSDPVVGEAGEELIKRVVVLLELLNVMRLTWAIVVFVATTVCPGEAIAVGVGRQRPMWRVGIGVDHGDASLQHVGDVAQCILRMQAEAWEAGRQLANRKVIDDFVTVDVQQVSSLVQNAAAEPESLEGLGDIFVAEEGVISLVGGGGPCGIGCCRRAIGIWLPGQLVCEPAIVSRAERAGLRTMDGDTLIVGEGVGILGLI